MRQVGSLIVYESPDSPQWKFAELDTCVRTFTGPYSDLFAMRPPRGEPMEGTGDNMIVQDSSLKRSKLNQGILTVNLVGGNPSSTAGSGPLKIVSEIDWVGVQKDLRMAPVYASGASVITGAGWAKIEKWKNEPDYALKVGGTEADPVYKFKDTDGIEVTLSANESKAAKKILRGVEGYTVYAPVIRKTSTFSEQPTPGSAGFIQDPDVAIDYPNDFEYLKTACKDIQNQDKTWQRQEEWTGADEVDEDLYSNAPASAPAPGSSAPASSLKPTDFSLQPSLS